jgi:hypothetical protein
MKTGQKEAAYQPDTRQKPGANDEDRTRYLHLGKVALYQMSYIRTEQVV